MSSTKSNNIAAFRTVVWKYYRKHGRRDLPWRHTHDAYRILVSEIMLQQTQVERVTPYYRNFLKQFPTVHALRDAPLSSVLSVWQGLGYNRRAKMLHEAARQIVKEYKGKFPRDERKLESLRGVGPYTARAVAAFAYNRDMIFVETNIRTAVMHHFFPKKKKVSDEEIENILVAVLPLGRAREWYSALMDYGAYLKKSGVRLNAKSKHYTKQAKFEGSLRQARGAILRALHAGAKNKKTLLVLLGKKREIQMQTALSALTREGFVIKRGNRYALAS